MKKFTSTILFTLTLNILAAQNADSLFIKSIFSNTLSDSTSYKNLRYLCKNIGGRISGSDQAKKAVNWAKELFEKSGVDTVYLQECMVRKWERGLQELCFAKEKGSAKQNFDVCALGGSIGTGKSGITAKVVEVKSFEEIKALGKDNINGKIVFFNRPADPTLYNTFAAYGGVAGLRFFGASIAASYGAVASICRSLTVVTHDYPHTGIMHYVDSLPKIPTFAISTADANKLSLLIKDKPLTDLYLKSYCKEIPETTSYNVIAEIKGSKYPKEIIAIGAHLDAWDNGEGAHDDGCGVVQVLDVIRIFKELNYTPLHTIRVIEFMDEEMAQRGGRKYAETVKNKNEKHIAAIESDEGGFLPQGFSFEAGDYVAKRFEEWKPLLTPYGLWNFHKGYSGVDISFLEDQNFPLFGLINDSQRYFNYQHAATDVFEAVNQRELQLGSASIASLVYLIDKYGF